MNPWAGEGSWRELLYDMRHPIDLFWTRARQGLREAVAFIQNGFQ